MRCESCVLRRENRQGSQLALEVLPCLQAAVAAGTGADWKSVNPTGDEFCMAHVLVCHRVKVVGLFLGDTSFS